MCPPEWARINLFKNLGETMVSHVPPVVTLLAAVSRRPRVSMLQFIYCSSSMLDRFLCLKFSWVYFLMNFIESKNLDRLKFVHNQDIILHYFSFVMKMQNTKILH